MLIDIHTHNSKVKNNGQLRLIVGKHSFGIHPWELIEPFDVSLYEKQFQQLKAKFNSRVLVIGECGLDRRRVAIASIEKQVKVLEWHLDWATQEKRPIIIHCVRALSDFLKILKDKKYRGKILLHDYAGNLSAAQAFLKYDCYFSFGARLFKKNSNAPEVFKSLPKERIFLETDDQQEFKIEEIYQKAQSLLGIDQQNLEELMERNLGEFFSNLDNVSTADVIDNLGDA